MATARREQTTSCGSQASGRKKPVWLDENLIADVRARAADAARSDDETVTDALNAYLLGLVLDELGRPADLSDEDALRLAYEELHAMRRERPGDG